MKKSGGLNLINIDILYPIGGQIKCTFWKSMFHDSSLGCWDSNQVQFIKGWFFLESYPDSKTPIRKCYHNMKSDYSIRNFISLVTFICSTDGLNQIGKKIHHFLPIGRQLPGKKELDNLIKFWQICGLFLKEKWKIKTFNLYFSLL